MIAAIVRVLQIGAGSWGASWAHVVRAAPEVELVGLVDLDPEALERVGAAARLPRERRFRTLSEAIARIEADAVLVAVPPAAHAEVAREALEAGLHCLVEKPLALTAAEAERVVERAEEAGRTLMVAQDKRFTRGALTVRRLLAEGALGRLGAIRVRFSRGVDVKRFHLEMAEPLLLDMAVHHLDQLRAFGVEPARVWARSYNPPWSPLPGNAAAELLLEAGEGLPVVAYSGTWAARGPDTSWTAAWEIDGERGALLWDGDRVELLPAGRGRRRRVKLLKAPAEGRLGVLAELTAAVRERREPETSGRDNLRTLALVLAAIESAKSGLPVELGR